MKSLAQNQESVKNTDKLAVNYGKGGVGKSTTVFNLAIALQKENIDVVVIDMDTQKSTYKLNLLREEKGLKPLELYTAEEILEEYALGRGIEEEMEIKDKVRALTEFLEEHEGKKKIFDIGGYDDDLGRIATTLSDYILIPMRANDMDELALMEFKELIDDIKETREPIVKVMFTMVNPRTKNFSYEEDKMKILGFEVLKAKLKLYTDYEKSFPYGVVELKDKDGKENKAKVNLLEIKREIYG